MRATQFRNHKLMARMKRAMTNELVEITPSIAILA